jgi:hypothetical protein
MNSIPPDDPLVALWQTAPKPDTQHLIEDLRRANRLHQRLDRSVFAILCGFVLLLIFEESTGGIATHGVLSAIWILGLGLGVARYQRARCHRSDAYTSDTVSLLQFLIARAKRDQFLARCLYAGAPCGAAAGYAVMKLAGIGAPQTASAVAPQLRLVQMGAGVAVLMVMMVTGAVLARARRAQVAELSEKLRLLESGL